MAVELTQFSSRSANHNPSMNGRKGTR